MHYHFVIYYYDPSFYLLFLIWNIPEYPTPSELISEASCLTNFLLSFCYFSFWRLLQCFFSLSPFLGRFLHHIPVHLLLLELFCKLNSFLLAGFWWYAIYFGFTLTMASNCYPIIYISQICTILFSWCWPCPCSSTSGDISL